MKNKHSFSNFVESKPVAIAKNIQKYGAVLTKPIYIFKET